ncbi:MAG TPA: hypothetical protein VMC10_15145 [Stellaceae bacterium]|nr:hypothetical protein [Stellaceae bacterium]
MAATVETIVPTGLINGFLLRADRPLKALSWDGIDGALGDARQGRHGRRIAGDPALEEAAVKD